MNAAIHVLSGARAGLTAELQWSEVTLGRHPESRVQLHPALDLEVSTHHAVLVPQGERWLLRDLHSRNGTYLNGRRISSDTPLCDGDRISLGQGGPVIEFQLPGLRTETASTGARAAGDVAGDLQEAAVGQRGDSEPVSTAVVRQNRRLRWLSGIMAVVLLVATTFSYFSERESRAGWERERLRMQLRVDSLLLASEASTVALAGMLGGLTAALRQSQDEIRQIGDQLRQAEAADDRSQVSSLRHRLQTATVALDRQQAVAALDFRGIEGRNRQAVAKVYVEYDDGEVATATAFAVRADARLLTSRHVVAGSDGRRGLRRMGIQFSDSDQIWPARVLAVASDADLALVKVDNIVGRVPTVQSLNLRADTVAAGAPVAMIGYPLGGRQERSNAPASQIARPLLSAGVVRARRADRFELQGYGAVGASGSPIFDANGEVIAVLFGGRRDQEGNQMLYSVPASLALRLLETTP